MRKALILLTKYWSLVKAVFYKKRLFNVFMIICSYMAKKHKVAGLPFFVQLEPTNRCNLHCSLCITGSNRLKRPKRDMNFQEFVQVINQFEASLVYLALYNLGEPLLNPHLYKMVEYAKSKNIFVRLSTNADFEDSRHIKNIINSGIDELIISLDCVNPQVYLKYKDSKNFQNVIKNIELIIKERKTKQRPFINIQLLVIRDNEKDIPCFKSLVRQLKADKGLIKNVRINFPGLKPDRSFLPLNDKYTRSSYKYGHKMEECFRPWLSTVILCDNSIVPCCFDMQGEYNFGNLNNSDFLSIWNNKEYELFRKQILNSPEQIPLCKQCSMGDFFSNFIRA